MPKKDSPFCPIFLRLQFLFAFILLFPRGSRAGQACVPYNATMLPMQYWWSDYFQAMQLEEGTSGFVGELGGGISLFSLADCESEDGPVTKEFIATRISAKPHIKRELAEQIWQARQISKEIAAQIDMLLLYMPDLRIFPLSKKQMRENYGRAKAKIPGVSLHATFLHQSCELIITCDAKIERKQQIGFLIHELQHAYDHLVCRVLHKDITWHKGDGFAPYFPVTANEYLEYSTAFASSEQRINSLAELLEKSQKIELSEDKRALLERYRKIAKKHFKLPQHFSWLTKNIRGDDPLVYFLVAQDRLKEFIKKQYDERLFFAEWRAYMYQLFSPSVISAFFVELHEFDIRLKEATEKVLQRRGVDSDCLMSDACAYSIKERRLRESRLVDDSWQYTGRILSRNEADAVLYQISYLLKSQQLFKAKQLATRLLEQMRKIGNKEHAARAKLHLGTIAYKTGHYLEARRFFKQAHKVIKSEDFYPEQMLTYADALLKSGFYKDAKKIRKRADWLVAKDRSAQL